MSIRETSVRQEFGVENTIDLRTQSIGLVRGDLPNHRAKTPKYCVDQTFRRPTIVRHSTSWEFLLELRAYAGGSFADTVN